MSQPVAPTIAIATPVAADLVEAVRREFPQVAVRHEPDLLPPQRWVADHVGDPGFARTPAQEERFAEMVATADVLYGFPGESSDGLAAAVRSNPGLRWVQGMAAGAGAQVRDAGLGAEDLARVAFTTSAGVHAGPLAEFALFGLMAGAKGLARLTELKARREWPGRWPMGQIGEQTVLVVGCGRIGQEVATKVGVLGARVIATNEGPVDHPAVERVFAPDALGDAVAQADAIVLTLPDSPATRGLIGADVFARCKAGVTVVNVGRGVVVDEGALLDALEAGVVGQAVLDVFAVEPLPARSPLWDHPRVVVSPHTAGLNEAEDRLIMDLFRRNLGRFLAGEPLVNLVDTVRWY